jgi:hypothetical protein
MDDPNGSPLGSPTSLPRYPAQSRPEQPMPQSESSWPWVFGAAVLISIAIMMPLVFMLVLWWRGDGGA